MIIHPIPDRIYLTAKEIFEESYDVNIDDATEYIRADKVYKALEELKSIQAYIEATNSDNSFLMAKVQSAIREIEG